LLPAAGRGLRRGGRRRPRDLRSRPTGPGEALSAVAVYHHRRRDRRDARPRHRPDHDHQRYPRHPRGPAGDLAARDDGVPDRGGDRGGPGRAHEEETEEALPAPEIDRLALIALPDGENPDHTGQEDRIIDGDTSDSWSTQHYASPDYGGIKEGVGIRLQFAEPSTFTALTVTTARNNGGVIELRTVDEDGSPGDVLATGEFVADGE